MSIRYRMKENALTSPSSFYAIVEPKTILDIDDIAYHINAHHPTITKSVAKQVIESLSSEILYQLVEGNTVNIEGFASFRSSLPVKLDSATDPLPSNVIDAKFNASKVIKDQLKESASFERLPFDFKQPTLLSVKSVITGISKSIETNYPIELVGSNISYNFLNDDEGIFIEKDGVTIKQTNIMLNDPSKILFIPDLSGFAPSDNPEYLLQIKTRYTDNGSLRKLGASIKMRGAISITSGSTLFGIDGQPGPVICDSYPLEGESVVFTAVFDRDETVRISVLPSGVELVGGTQVIEDGQTLSYEVLEETVVLSIDSKETLIENLNASGGFLQDVSSSTGSSPIVVEYTIAATGQTTCYNASGSVISCVGSGQDGEYQAGKVLPQPRFTDNNDGTITDNLTTMIWCKLANPSGVKINWNQALLLAANAQDGMYGLTDSSSPGDWKIPNINEIKSLRVYGFADPCVTNMEGTDKNGASGTESFIDLKYASISDRYWSSTTRNSSRDQALYCSMRQPLIFYDDKGSDNYCLLLKVGTGEGSTIKTGAQACYDENGLTIPCVDTGQDAEFQSGSYSTGERFSLQQDGSVLDNITQLTWKADTQHGGTLYNWQNALNAANLEADYRMPNIVELASLLYYGDMPLFIDDPNNYFSNVGGLYWSSTTLAENGLTFVASVLDLDLGLINNNTFKSSSAKLWLVKG